MKKTSFRLPKPTLQATKTYLFTVVFLLSFGVTKSFSQASIVFDPTNYAEAINTTTEIFYLGQTMQKLKDIQEKIENFKDAVTWLKTAESVIQIIKLIEETACIIERLNINLNIALDLGITQSCIGNFEYRVSFAKLLLAIDQINSVLSEGTKMEQAQRWQIISIVLDNFTQSQMNFAAINKNIQKQIYAKKIKHDIVKDNRQVVNIISSYYE